MVVNNILKVSEMVIGIIILVCKFVFIMIGNILMNVVIEVNNIVLKCWLLVCIIVFLIVIFLV